MFLETSITASSIDASGAYKNCAELCSDCPRRTGERTVRARGWRGWLLRRTETIQLNSNPLRSGVIRSIQTNSRHGHMLGEGNENSGTVTGLRPDTAAEFIEAVIECEGPVDNGDICTALGPRSFGAICDLDASMEEVIDTLPIENILAGMMTDATEVPAQQIAETVVFINHSKPVGQ